MIHAGDTIENPITGEGIVFNKTSAETSGEAVEIEVYVRPGGVVAAAHVHPYQTERFEVVSGRIGLKLGRRKLEAGPNDNVVVEPGTPHKFWNAADRELHFVTGAKPAVRFQRTLRTALDRSRTSAPRAPARTRRSRRPPTRASATSTRRGWAAAGSPSRARPTAAPPSARRSRCRARSART